MPAKKQFVHVPFEQFPTLSIKIYEWLIQLKWLHTQTQTQTHTHIQKVTGRAISTSKALPCHHAMLLLTAMTCFLHMLLSSVCARVFSCLLLVCLYCRVQYNCECGNVQVQLCLCVSVCALCTHERVVISRVVRRLHFSFSLECSRNSLTVQWL